MNMINLLKYAETELPELLLDKDGWNSKLVDYTEPVVWRIWRDFPIGNKNFRLYGHMIWPSTKPFFHKHPWESAIKVLKVGGYYEMGIGYGETEPPIACTIQVPGNFYYEMVHPLGWHYVKVTGGPSLSIMLTGPPDLSAKKTCSVEQKPLSPTQRDQMFQQLGYHIWGP